VHRGQMHEVNAHDHVQDWERHPDTGKCRYYCTCGWATPWRTPLAEPEAYAKDFIAAGDHFRSAA
jgi:hypothetical protein